MDALGQSVISLLILLPERPLLSLWSANQTMSYDMWQSLLHGEWLEVPWKLSILDLTNKYIIKLCCITLYLAVSMIREQFVHQLTSQKGNVWVLAALVNLVILSALIKIVEASMYYIISVNTLKPVNQRDTRVMLLVTIQPLEMCCVILPRHQHHWLFLQSAWNTNYCSRNSIILTLHCTISWFRLAYTIYGNFNIAQVI